MLLSVNLLSYLVWSELPDVNTMGGLLIMIGSRSEFSFDRVGMR